MDPRLEPKRRRKFATQEERREANRQKSRLYRLRKKQKKTSGAEVTVKVATRSLSKAAQPLFQYSTLIYLPYMPFAFAGGVKNNLFI